LKRNKFKSVKTWVVIWAIALITFIVISGKVEFLQLAILLSTVPLAYLPVNAYQHKLESNQDNK